MTNNVRFMINVLTLLVVAVSCGPQKKQMDDFVGNYSYFLLTNKEISYKYPSSNIVGLGFGTLSYLQTRSFNIELFQDQDGKVSGNYKESKGMGRLSGLRMEGDTLAFEVANAFGESVSFRMFDENGKKWLSYQRGSKPYTFNDIKRSVDQQFVRSVGVRNYLANVGFLDLDSLDRELVQLSVDNYDSLSLVITEGNKRAMYQAASEVLKKVRNGRN